MQRGSHHSPEALARIMVAARGRHHSPAVRARISEANRRTWADPQVRASRIAALKRVWADPEVHARMSEANRRAWGLSHLSIQQRADYNILRRKGGYDRATALAMVELPRTRSPM